MCALMLSRASIIYLLAQLLGKEDLTAKGIYRDPVRSSHGHFVKTSALRWVCLTLLAPVPWASRVWALPFLSALAHCERYAKECAKRHKPLTEWAWQMLLLVSKALVPETPDRGRRRWRVCLFEALGPLPEAQGAHRLHHPP